MTLITIIVVIFISIVLGIGIFWKDKLARYCILTPIKLFIYSSITSIFLWGISTSFISLEEWNSSFAPKNLEMFLYPLLISSCCSIASYGMCLNIMKTIRMRWMASLLSFFLLPSLTVLYFVLVPYWDSNTPITTKTVLLPIFYSFGFFLFDIYFYIKFRKRVMAY